MARKRMISPEIWASSSFAELSDFAKIVFIGLISNADDEGKGEADPALLKSTLFPRDEKKRAADVKSALSEIARSTSTLFYSVEGKNYYVLIKWRVYQKLDRPTPSKIPNPVQEQSVGERGSCTQNPTLGEGSTNTRRILDENSPLIEKNTNRREENRKEIKISNNNSTQDAHASKVMVIAASDNYPHRLLDKPRAESDWEVALNRLDDVIHALAFDVWIKPLVAIGYVDNTLVIMAPSIGHRNEILNKYLDKIKSAVNEVCA